MSAAAAGRRARSRSGTLRAVAGEARYRLLSKRPPWRRPNTSTSGAARGAGGRRGRTMTGGGALTSGARVRRPRRKGRGRVGRRTPLRRRRRAAVATRKFDEALDTLDQVEFTAGPSGSSATSCRRRSTRAERPRAGVRAARARARPLSRARRRCRVRTSFAGFAAFDLARASRTSRRSRRSSRTRCSARAPRRRTQPRRSPR